MWGAATALDAPALDAIDLREAVARRCDGLFHIPQRGQVASLNASVAGAIVLYEAARQRRK